MQPTSSLGKNNPTSGVPASPFWAPNLGSLRTSAPCLSHGAPALGHAVDAISAGQAPTLRCTGGISVITVAQQPKAASVSKGPATVSEHRWSCVAVPSQPPENAGQRRWLAGPLLHVEHGRRGDPRV